MTVPERLSGAQTRGLGRFPESAGLHVPQADRRNGRRHLRLGSQQGTRRLGG